MNTLISKRQIAWTSLWLAFLAVPSGIAWAYLGDSALLLSVILAVAVILLANQADTNRLRLMLADMDRRGKKGREADFRQTEALLSLYSTLKPEFPFPETRSWAASPDLLKKIMDMVLAGKPDLVVEASSGASSLVIGHCLRKLGKGKVLSLEHDPFFAAQTRERILQHGLEKFVTILDAPLVTRKIGNEERPWYSLEPLKLDRKIDMLVIDGPPAGIGKLARYPAIPLLYDSLAPGAKVLLDDAGREDERECVRRWLAEYRDLGAQFLELEKGACVVTRNSMGERLQ